MVRRKHRLPRIAAIVVLTGTTVAVLLPVWLPWMLRPALRTQGVEFADYERAGFTRFALHDVRFQKSRAQFTARRVEAATPHVWLWRRWTQSDTARPVLSVDQWELTFDTAHASSNTAGSFHALVEKVGQRLPTLRNWLPAVIATDGAIQFGTNRITVADLNWQHGALSACAAWLPRVTETTLQLNMSRATPDGLPAQLTLTSPTNGAIANLNLSRSDGLPGVEGFVAWQSNRLELTAQFGRDGWWPESATARVMSPQLRSSGYAAATGDLAIQWRTNHFTLNLAARAQPQQTNELTRPPIEAVAVVSGSTRSVRIERATIAVPGIEARLADPVEMDFSGRLLSDAAFDLKADLMKQPALTSTGQVEGRVVLKSVTATRRWPVVEFDASATTAIIAGLSIEHAMTRGKMDLDSRLVEEAALSADIRADSRWFQEKLAYDSLSLTGRVTGPFDRLKHTGQVSVNKLHTAALPPTDITAQWRGEAFDFHECKVGASLSEWSLDLAGSLDVDPAQSGFDAQLQSAALQRNGESLLRLVAPARVVAARATSSGRMRLNVQDFNWQGPGGELTLNSDVTWPEAGRADLKVMSVETTRWIGAPALPWRETWIQNCDLSAAWSNSPVEFRLSASARTGGDETNVLRGELQLSGGREGLRIEELAVFGPSGRSLTAKGALPVTIEPSHGDGIVRVHDESPLSIEVATSPGAQFWNRIAEWTGVRLLEPDAQLSISGTLADIQGRIQARARSAEIQTAKTALPKFEELRAEATFSSTNASLKEFTALVEGQQALVSATVPLSATFWKQIKNRENWPDLEQVSGRIQVANADVKAFARFLPHILSPQGQVNLDLALRPGLNLAGTLSLTNAATRGLLPSGPIRDVQAQVRFDERRAEIEQFSGALAGQTVGVSGHLAWPVAGEPEFTLRLRGQRVPLARQPGFILRSDVDLTLASSNAAPPSLTGTLRLRDSFYLAELRSLMPGRAQSPLQRPPYFSVTNALYANWKLGVKVEGARGLRMRTPLFRGVMSPDLTLGGTLREPKAIGEVRVNEGRVLFPFCSIKIEQGRVALAADNPYRPELFIAGTARAFDYDLQLHVTGFADDPHWEMSSYPPLSPEAIVLLVTAGEVPGDSVNFNERQRAGRLVFFLGKSLFSELWLEDSMADRLVIRSGESVTRDGRETYSLEYQATGRWSLVGEYDRFNDVNAGVKWRVYSK